MIFSFKESTQSSSKQLEQLEQLATKLNSSARAGEEERGREGRGRRGMEEIACRLPSVPGRVY